MFGRGGQIAHFGIEGFDKAGHQIGRHQSLLEPDQDAVFKFVAAYQQPIRAGTLRSVRRAAVAVTADDGIAAATRATDQQTTQEKLPSVHAVERIAAGVTADLQAQHFLACLDPLPERIIDDAQVRHLNDLPLFARIGARDTLAGAGILDVAAAVPFKPPNVEDIVEETGAPLGLATNGCVAPWATIGAGYAFSIKLLSDCARALPVRKFSEYTANDRGFDRIDLPFAGCGSD